jgi:hypothetical protein
MGETCKLRAWGSGDKEDCGSPAGSHGYCQKCYPLVRGGILARIREAERDLESDRLELRQLEAAEARDIAKRCFGGDI